MNARLAESLPGPIGFVLGGGGSLGAIQVGMLQSLADHGIHADLVTGTSIGAVNGAVVAADPVCAASRLSHMWADPDLERWLPGGALPRLWRLIRRRIPLYDTPGLARLVEDEIGDVRIEDLAVPFGVVAMDVETSTGVTLRNGGLTSALLASSAIPGVFAPVERNGRLLYDGGLVTNVPVLEALAMGAKSLVVADCGFPDQQVAPPTDVVSALLYSMRVSMGLQAHRDLPVAASEVPVLYLPGPRPEVLSPLDFSHSPRLIRAGYEAARAFLDTVVVSGPGLYRLGRDRRPLPVEDVEPRDRQDARRREPSVAR